MYVHLLHLAFGKQDADWAIFRAGMAKLPFPGVRWRVCTFLAPMSVMRYAVFIIIEPRGLYHKKIREGKRLNIPCEEMLMYGGVSCQERGCRGDK